ncbi:UNVERIFIED_ORG: hypothetical protein QFZ59_004127 [Bacillus sp. B2I3]|nr:hypothetical protein [Bacillus sp. B2I3]
MGEQFIEKKDVNAIVVERNITDFPTDNDEVVKFVKRVISDTDTITEVFVKIGTEMEQTLIPLDNVSISYRDNVKIMSFGNGPTLFLTLTMYFKSTFKGLGYGRGKCGTDVLNEDCVDRDTFLDKCFIKFYQYSSPFPGPESGEWYWEKARCGECGNPPC